MAALDTEAHRLALASVWVHPSQFPDRLQQDLLESLQSRRIAPKFLYDSVQQARRWIQLHRALSPARSRADTLGAYLQAATQVAGQLHGRAVYLIGLGCGDGYKDGLVLERLLQAGCPVHYAALDASLALALTARAAALRWLPPDRCQAWVADLGQADDLPQCFEAVQPSGAGRCITCFGLLPNFQPQVLLPRLRALVRSGDWLILSANLALGPDYAAALADVLPQYDNPPTRAWLMGFLRDLGVGENHGRLEFSLEADPAQPPLRRLVARFVLDRDCTVGLGDQAVLWPAGEAVQVFFSYRYTPELVSAALAQHGLVLAAQWIDPSGQEGVFLARAG